MKINLLSHPYQTTTMLMGLLILFLFSPTLYANDIVQSTITGRVVSSEDNLGIPGVNVLIKEVPGVGAVTDMEGNYSINAPSDATLVYSYIGFRTVERKINDQS